LVNTKKDNELIELRVKLEAANTRINDLEKDKEEWREQARVLALAPPNQSKKSWLGRLFSS
jgi:chaperonin cofactor prefoldin